MSTASERARAIGGVVIAGLLLVVGIVYLVQTLAAGNRPEVSLYPLACVGVLLVLVVTDLVVSVVRWGRPSTAPASGGDASKETGERAAAERADAEVADLEAEDAGPTRWSVFVPLLVGMIAFAFVALTVDYLLGTAAFMFAAVWWLGRPRFNWWKTLIIAVASAVAVHLLFVSVLHLRLPSVIPGL